MRRATIEEMIIDHERELRENKEQFDKWLVEYFNQQVDNGYSGPHRVDRFNYEPKEMQCGVYLDYLDSIGMEVDVFKETAYNDIDEGFFWCVEDRDTGHEPTRQEALITAFKKADELINK